MTGTRCNHRGRVWLFLQNAGTGDEAHPAMGGVTKSIGRDAQTSALDIASSEATRFFPTYNRRTILTPNGYKNGLTGFLAELG
jgi:hypothetical protein